MRLNDFFTGIIRTVAEKDDAEPDCLTPGQVRGLFALDVDVSCHIYFCVRCFLMLRQHNPDYLEQFENAEKEWDKKFRRSLAKADRDYFLFQLARYGLTHLTDREIVDFNLLEDEFETEILVCIYEHLAECFRCRSKCRRLRYEDFRRAYPPCFTDLYVRNIFRCYLTDAEIVFGENFYH